MDINKIIQFILDPEFSGGLLALKIIFILFGLSFLFIIIVFLIKTTWLKRILLWDIKDFLSYQPYGEKKIAKKLEKIKEKLNTRQPTEMKLAILEADSILDKMLKRMGYKGKDLGERLDKLDKGILYNIEEVRQAHKIKNNIMTAPDYKLEVDEARQAIESYEKALSELQAL